MMKQDLVMMMVGMLTQALEDEGSTEPGLAGPDSPLLGVDAVLTSMGLVTLITDVESVLEEEHNIEVTLVSEDAFSRRKSPFRTVEALADYILEISEAANRPAGVTADSAGS